MTRRYFWQMPEKTKFRTVFENDDTVLGVNDRNEHKLFRKDTGCIVFAEPRSRRARLREVSRRESVTRVVRLVPRLFPQTA